MAAKRKASALLHKVIFIEREFYSPGSVEEREWK